MASALPARQKLLQDAQKSLKKLSLSREEPQRGSSAGSSARSSVASRSSSSSRRPSLPGQVDDESQQQQQQQDEERDEDEEEGQRDNNYSQSHFQDEGEDEESEQAAEAWKAFGADTEAGRMLAKLYGSKKAEIQYPAVKTKKREPEGPFIPGGGLDIESRTRRLPKGNSERKINVPKQNKTNYEPAPLILTHKGVRKSSAEIEKDMETIQRRVNAYRPMPAREKSTDAEKQRLQSKFTYEGGHSLPAGALPGKMDPAMLASRKTQATLRGAGYQRKEGQDLQELFESIRAEIEERESFLEQVRSLGEGKKYEQSIRAEIKERVTELERINRVIQAEDQ